MAGLRYVVEGGHRLSGTIRPAGNKNAALPIVAAALLTEDEVMLENVPRIRDIETLVLLLRSVGAEAEWTAPNSLRIRAKEIRAAALDPDLGDQGLARAARFVGKFALGLHLTLVIGTLGWLFFSLPGMTGSAG